MQPVLEESMLSPPVESPLPDRVQEKLGAIYEYIENSILYPLRMASDLEDLEKEFDQVLAEYQQLRVTVNLLLLHELGEPGVSKVYTGIQDELEAFTSSEDLGLGSSKRELRESFERAFELSNLIMRAVSNTPETAKGGGEEDPLDFLPEKRLEEFENLTDLIGKWELAASAALSALTQEQGKEEVISHLVEMAIQSIQRAEEKAGEVIKPCANCDQPFLLKRTNQKYCSQSCLSKARNRRYRKSRGED